MPKYKFKVRIAKDNRKAVLKHLSDAISDSLYEIGEEAVEWVKAYAPIDTGALSASYYHEEDENDQTVTVGSDLEYAPYVELGTGPNYKSPPDWVTNNAVGGYHDIDPWWYMGEDGEWHLGWFIRAQPHLEPAFLKHVSTYKRIFKDNLKNA